VQVILFSDILTPLTGMNIPFDILKSKGPIIHNPIRTAADVAQVRELVPAEAVPYVGQALTALREEVRVVYFWTNNFFNFFIKPN
jgi:uroporphyrinogen decarboxylase